MAYLIYTSSTGMARAWDIQGKYTVHVSGQATTVLGKQYACVGFLQSASDTQSRGGNTAGGVIEYQGECD